MINTILAPLDGTAAAEAGLRWAENAASRCGASICLFTALDHPETPANGHREKATDYLAAQTGNLRANGLDAEFEVRNGPGAELILERAATADLTVMTYGTSRWLFGGVLDGVLQRMTKPIVVVRTVAGQPCSLPATEEILVPLDDSPYSTDVLAVAQELARAMGASIVLCHIIEPIGQYRDGADAPPGIARTIEALLAEGRAFVETVAQRVIANGVPAETIVVMGEAAQEIVRIAERSQAGLIAMATRGRDRLETRMVGSVANAVVQATHLPCLLVRAGSDR